MSVDLEVVTHLRPSTDHVTKFIHDRSDFDWEGTLDGPTGLITIHKRGAVDSILVTVEGLSAVEAEDVSDRLAAAVLAPQWFVLLSAPLPGGKLAIRLLRELAQYLAQECQGAVYDPQRETIVWPKTRRRRPPKGIDTNKIDVVKVTWIFDLTRLSRESFQTFSRLLKIRVPECSVADRYGTARPFQYRLERGHEEEFFTFCLDKSATLTRAIVHWKTEWPCFDGEFSIRRSGGKGSAAWALSLVLDKAPLDGEERWREAVVRLFAEVAEQLTAIYGAMYVDRNYIVSRQGLGFDHETENLIIPLWNGLPSFPTWVSWFGESYKMAIGKQLPNGLTKSRKHGIVLRMGDKPMNQDQLFGIFPPLPRELVQNSRWEKRVVIHGNAHQGTSTWFQEEAATTILPLHT